VIPCELGLALVIVGAKAGTLMRSQTGVLVLDLQIAYAEDPSIKVITLFIEKKK
jgi:hypothetical protein